MKKRTCFLPYFLCFWLFLFLFLFPIFYFLFFLFFCKRLLSTYLFWFGLTYHPPSSSLLSSAQSRVNAGAVKYFSHFSILTLSSVEEDLEAWTEVVA